jgi:hypothetical protein
MDPLLIAAVPLPLKILAAIVVFGPVIVFARFLIRAAREDGEIQEERKRGTGR